MLEYIKKELELKNLKFDKEKIALHLIEGENYYSVCYNYMGTKIHIPIEQVDEDKCKEESIKIWKTWSYKN